MAQVTVDIQHWSLTDDAAMHQCLHDMSGNGFRGQVRVFPEPAQPDALPGWKPKQLWDLELNDNAHPERPAVTAVTGDVVVFFAGVLQKLTAAEYSAQFGVTA